jgi:hypothetical protein
MHHQGRSFESDCNTLRKEVIGSKCYIQNCWIKEEEVDLSEYECYTDAVSQLSRFLNDVYMHKRIHSSLGYLTPAEFEEQWRRGREQPLDVN